MLNHSESQAFNAVCHPGVPDQSPITRPWLPLAEINTQTANLKISRTASLQEVEHNVNASSPLHGAEREGERGPPDLAAQYKPSRGSMLYVLLHFTFGCPRTLQLSTL